MSENLNPSPLLLKTYAYPIFSINGIGHQQKPIVFSLIQRKDSRVLLDELCYMQEGNDFLLEVRGDSEGFKIDLANDQQNSFLNKDLLIQELQRLLKDHLLYCYADLAQYLVNKHFNEASMEVLLSDLKQSMIDDFDYNLNETMLLIERVLEPIESNQQVKYQAMMAIRTAIATQTLSEHSFTSIFLGIITEQHIAMHCEGFIADKLKEIDEFLLEIAYIYRLGVIEADGDNCHIRQLTVDEAQTAIKSIDETNY